MKKRWYFIPAFLIIITLFIVGTFYDLEIAKAIFSHRNPFSVFVSGVYSFPLVMFGSFIGGCFVKKGLTSYSKKRSYQITLVILGIIFALGCIAFGGFDICNYHSYGIKYYYGLIISIVISIPFFIIAFKIFYKIDSDNLIKVLIILILIFIIDMCIIQGIKICSYRIRYTSLVHFNHFDWYRSWYDPSISKEIADTCKAYYREEAKSFPSGHASVSVVIMAMLFFLPYIDKKTFKNQTLLFFIGFIYFIIVSLARMIMGSHYLTDTMFGGFVGLSLLFIGNEIYIRKIDINKGENK